MRLRVIVIPDYSRSEGTATLVDALLDAAEATVSAGVREMCS